METRSDNVVMQQVREGEVGKLAILFERYHRPLYGYLARLTGDRDLAEDLVQEVFFRVLKYRASWQDGSHFPAWLYQIARRAHLDAVEKRKGEVIPFPGDDSFPEPASPEPDPGERLRQAQQIRLLRRALAALPVEKREVLLLSRFQDLKYEQISEILACDVGAVKVRVYRALKALGQLFFEMSGEKAS